MAIHWTSASINVPDKPLLTVADVATILEVNARTIRRWVARGTFPQPKLVEGRQRWTALSVGVWLAWQEYARTAEPDPGDAETVIENPAPEQSGGRKQKTERT